MTGKLPPDAFDVYMGLGPDRSYEAVAKRYGVSKRAVTKRAAKEKWQERVSKIEQKARESSDKKVQESLEAMNDRHLKMTQAIQGKALQALREMALDSAMGGVRALDQAIRLERLIRGEPSDRTALGLEEVIRKEVDHWLTDEDDNEDEQDDEAQEEDDGDEDS